MIVAAVPADYPAFMRAGRAAEPAIESDDRIVARCLRGDEAAWRDLVERYSAYIYAIAVRAYRLDPAAADEVFQDVWVRLYDGLPGYSGRGDFRSWLRAVVLSACREFLRQASRPRAGEDPGGDGADLDRIEAALDVRSAVWALGEPCRTTIGMYFYRDLTQAEVARSLGVPAGTVAARLSRCLRRLREALQEEPGVPPSSERHGFRPSPTQ